MTVDDYVKSIHVFSERNPRPVIARFYLGPQTGKAEINTRIRLAGTQQVVALAIMNNGSAWLGDPRRMPLQRHDEIVLEVGGYVRPHARYLFPEGQ